VANLDFFAVGRDQEEIFEFLFESTDIRLFELASAPGTELREFKSLVDVQRSFELGSDPFGNGVVMTFQLWSPSVMSRLEVRKVKLDPRHCEGHTFRHELEGGALMQLYLGGIHGRVITKSHFGHNSEVRAEKWGVSAGANWKALGTVSRKIQYHIAKRLAVDRVPGRPVLAGAAALWNSGYELKESAKSPHKWSHEGLCPVV